VIINGQLAASLTVSEKPKVSIADVPVPRCACSQAPEVNIKDRSSDLLASAVFVNDVDALSPLSIPSS
jgi:hypothetical protein